MRRTWLLLCAFVTACTSAPPAPISVSSSASIATAAGPAPGQWQLVIEIDDLPGAGRIPPQNLSMCSTPEDKKQWQDMVGGKAMAGCNVTDFNTTGAQISYALRCGEGIEGSAKITIIDDDHYRGESTLMMSSGDKPATIRSRMTATRIARTCGK